MYLTLFMTMVTLLAVMAGIANTLITRNSEAARAWGVSTLFAVALFARNLGDLLKYMG